MIRISIMGATGYSGGELLRLLLNRPGLRLTHVTSESSPGKKVSSVHPSLRGLTDLVFEKVDAFSDDRFEDLLLSITKKEFRFIELVGGFFGFLIGIIQMLIESM